MNRFTLKKLSLLMALVLMGSISVGCSKNDDDANQGSTDNDTAVATTLDADGQVVQTTAEVITTTEDTRTKGEAVVGEINEETENEDIAITVKNVYRMSGVKRDGYVHVGLYCEIVNKSDVERTFSNLTHFGVRINGSTEDKISALSPANALVYIETETDFNNLKGTVAPGTVLDGIVPVVLPEDFTEATFVFYPNILSSTGEISFTFTPDDLEELPLT